MSTASQDPADWVPTPEIVQSMHAYNDQMREAGVLLNGEGLGPTTKSTRLRFDRVGDPTVTDGPFAEAKEVIAGFWEIEVRSREEAVEWARRAPLGGGTILDVRPIFDGPMPEDAEGIAAATEAAY